MPGKRVLVRREQRGMAGAPEDPEYIAVSTRRDFTKTRSRKVSEKVEGKQGRQTAGAANRACLPHSGKQTRLKHQVEPAVAELQPKTHTQRSQLLCLQPAAENSFHRF